MATSAALRRARRKRLNRLMTIAAAVTLVAGLAFVWTRVIQTLRAPAPAGQSQAVAEPGALVWDGRVFTTPAQLKAYLGPKKYVLWSKRHPTAFGAPASATARPTKATTTPAKTTRAKSTPTKTTPTKTTPIKTTSTKTTPIKTTSPPVAAAPPVATASQSRSVLARALTLLLVLGGLALGASALVPARIAPDALRRLYAQPDRRSIAIAAATAMVLGFGVSFYLS